MTIRLERYNTDPDNNAPVDDKTLKIGFDITQSSDPNKMPEEFDPLAVQSAEKTRDEIIAEQYASQLREQDSNE